MQYIKGGECYAEKLRKEEEHGRSWQGLLTIGENLGFTGLRWERKPLEIFESRRDRLCYILSESLKLPCWKRLWESSKGEVGDQLGGNWVIGLLGPS